MWCRNFLALVVAGDVLLARTGKHPADICGCAFGPTAGTSAFDRLGSGMKITGLKVFGVSLTRESDRPYVFIKLETNKGVIGWGESMR